MIDRLLALGPRLLILAGLACLAALAAALVAQHVYGVKPCPWCVLQRGIFLLLALFALGGGLIGLAQREPRRRDLALRAFAVPLVLLALTGLVAATYQHEVAAESESCAMTAADRILTALELEARWPAMFMVTANCNEAAAYRLLGLPYEIWSGLMFALVLALALLLLLRGAAAPAQFGASSPSR